ncbi:hypothetical protein HanRHA438_Chr09g0420031 [Helianthus annuus]|nr:hypothetical protein HanLR1_Chr09g0335531 [Helianthus annuus]KAJ0712882.1 hypothetical protein HanOQP8_Chr09g0339631 [Helianthus annuus]KAJ0890104.1 hypothetical protein HanRHA438_Chr09g0420031 [Helianthus annuus]KAJ0894875.1 hypothetical protein HanPSC8_Chr09g0393871 [Helianthus annuus]
MAVSISAVPEGVTAFSAPISLVSPPRAQKERRIMPPLTSFQAIKAAHALPAGSFVEAQVEGVSYVSLTTGNVVSSAVGGPNLSDLISQVSVVAVSSSMLPPVFTTAVVVTTSPVSTSLSSSATPVSLFDSPFGVFSASKKEVPTTSVVGESTSTRDATASDAGGSCSGFVHDRARLGDDLCLPTICWDPNVQDKRYEPKWKIAESSRLIFPPVVHN